MAFESGRKNPDLLSSIRGGRGGLPRRSQGASGWGGLAAVGRGVLGTGSAFHVGWRTAGRV